VNPYLFKKMTRIKKLAELINDLPLCCEVRGDISNCHVSGISFDSRQVKPGHIFVAFPGINTDGHDFIDTAVANGAVVVVGQRKNIYCGVPYVMVENTREAIAHLAAGFFEHPGRKLTVIGVTGTDGKTTTSNLIYQILLAAGIKTGLITTVNAIIGDEMLDTGFHVTTPEATEIQDYLARMVEAGLTHVVLETTSHGLAQHRVDGCEYDIAVVTNITHEHLDFHGSYDSYLEAKGRVFQMLAETVEKPQGNPRLAVLNADDRSYLPLYALSKTRKVSYGTIGTGDICGVEIQHSPMGLHFIARGESINQSIECNIPGIFNVSNCLAAFTTAVIGLGIDSEIAALGIKALAGVPGRMEIIDLGQPFTAIVDFAHTPNALKVAIETTREMTKGRVITVFGSAGLRDREKRKLMADVSVRLADYSVLTAEDPRTESLNDILAEMAEAATRAGGIEDENFFRVPDRGDAIRKGISLTKPGDLVIACGKGHEQSMCFGTVEYPWDDRTAMQAALGEFLKVAGPEMPKLPTSEK
jgi:UDP-N-acetylmuramoyl-L-alanyl-D-glutamate--2,6-diaminopimelate ligase